MSFEERVDHFGETLTNKAEPLDVRMNALYALKNLGGPKVIHYMTQAFGDNSTELKREAAFCLSVVCERTLAASVLSNVLSNIQEDPVVRIEAGISLGTLGCTETLPVLEKFSSDTSSSEIAQACCLASKRIRWAQTAATLFGERFQTPRANEEPVSTSKTNAMYASSRPAPSQTLTSSCSSHGQSDDGCSDDNGPMSKKQRVEQPISQDISIMAIPDEPLQQIFELANFGSEDLKCIRLMNTRLARLTLPDLIDKSKFRIEDSNVEIFCEFMTNHSPGMSRRRIGYLKRLTLCGVVPQSPIPLEPMQPLLKKAVQLKELTVAGEIKEDDRLCLANIHCPKLECLKVIWPCDDVLGSGFFGHPYPKPPIFENLKHLWLEDNRIPIGEGVSAAIAFEGLESLVLINQAHGDKFDECESLATLLSRSYNLKTLVIQEEFHPVISNLDYSECPLVLKVIATTCHKLKTLRLLGLLLGDNDLKTLSETYSQCDETCFRTSLEELEISALPEHDLHLELISASRAIEYLNKLTSLKTFRYALPVKQTLFYDYIEPFSAGLNSKFVLYEDPEERCVDNPERYPILSSAL